MRGDLNRKGQQDFFHDDFHTKGVKKSGGLPQKIRESLPLVVSLGLVLVFGTFFYVTSLLLREDFTVPPVDPHFQARLMMPVAPNKIYAPGSDKVVSKLEVRIKNVGKAEALNVWVDAYVGGQQASMLGPLRIRAGEEATYFVEGAIEVADGTKIRVTTMCWNCPASPGQPPDVNEIRSWREGEERMHGRKFQ